MAMDYTWTFTTAAAPDLTGGDQAHHPMNLATKVALDAKSTRRSASRWTSSRSLLQTTR